MLTQSLMIRSIREKDVYKRQVLDNLQDPGNLGTIFRTAEAAGATGILLSADCVDIYNPKVIRSTMGAVCRVPFYYAEDICGEIRKLDVYKRQV